MIAIWLPMLKADFRSDWPQDALDDPRVTSLWDQDRLAGIWFADHGTGGLGQIGSIVWDAYLTYGPEARWGSEPTEPIVAGSDVITHTAGLEEQFLPTIK